MPPLSSEDAEALAGRFTQHDGTGRDYGGNGAVAFRASVPARWRNLRQELLAFYGHAAARRDRLAPQQSEQTQELLRLYLFAGIAVTFGLAALLSFGIRA